MTKRGELHHPFHIPISPISYPAYRLALSWSLMNSLILGSQLNNKVLNRLMQTPEE